MSHSRCGEDLPEGDSHQVPPPPWSPQSTPLTHTECSLPLSHTWSSQLGLVSAKGHLPPSLSPQWPRGTKDER